jgi:hypothetical protein
MIGRQLSPQQRSFLRRAISLGQNVKRDFPEIAQAYRDGKTLAEIVEKYNLTERYVAQKKVAPRAVHYALTGYGGGLDLEPYQGLISDPEERVRLCKEHLRAAGKKRGEEATRNGSGIHAYPPGESRDKQPEYYHGQRGGLISKERKVGAMGLSGEQHRQNGLLGGLLGTIKRGNVPWEDEERRYVWELAQEPDFQYQRGRRVVVESSKIARQINMIYHNGKWVRTPESIETIIKRNRHLQPHNP